MADLSVKHSAPFNHKTTLSCKTLDFYLKLLLLLLLDNVKHNDSNSCPLTTEAYRFPNLTSEAGSPFFFKLPIPANPWCKQRYQLSRADGDGTLPQWMVFRQKTHSLAGLALTEDSGIYHLQVSVTGEWRAAYFHLHILNRTMTDKDSAREYLSCSEGKMTIWANLVLQLNPVTLDASQRIHLVRTMADYLRLPLGFVYLFSRKNSFTPQQEGFRICRQGGFAGSGTEKQDGSADVAQLLWRVSCQREEEHVNLANVVKYSRTAGRLARLLQAPILGWRLLCAPIGVHHHLRRDLQRWTVNLEPSHKYEPSLSNTLLHMNNPGTNLGPRDTSTENITIPSTRANTFPYSHSEKFFKLTSNLQKLQLSLESPFSIKQTTLYPYSYTLQEQQAFTGKMTLATEELKVTSDTSLSISEHFWATELFHLPFLPEHISTVRTFLEEPPADIGLSLFPSPTLHSIHPSLPLTPDSYSDTSPLTHEAVDRKSPATRLTLRPHPKESPLWTGACRASHTDSESQPTESSLGHLIYSHGPVTNHPTAKSTPHNLPYISHPPQAEHYNDVLLLNTRLKSMQSPLPSNKISSTQLFRDVSPTSYLMTKQLSITQHFDTIQHLSSGLNQDVVSQQNVTTQDVSSTTMTDQPTLSGQTELESSLSTTLLEPSMTTFTPALPSELDLLSGQLETPTIINPSSSLMPMLQTFPKSLPADVSSLQKDPESPAWKLDTQSCIDQNALMQILSSDILLTSLQPVYSLWAFQMSLPVTKTHTIISVPLSMFKEQPFEEQPSVKSTHMSMQFMTSVQQTLHSLLLVDSQEIDKFSHILATGVMSMYLNTAVLSTFSPDLSVIHPVSLSINETTRLVSEDHFDPTAPSVVQKPYITSSMHTNGNLEPSFPLCSHSVAQDHFYGNKCTPQVKSTYRESTLEYILGVLTSHSEDDRYWTAGQSQFLKFDSSGQFFSTQTLNSTRHLSAGTTAEINHVTATPQMDISSPLPFLEDSGFSVITYTPLAHGTSALSGNCVSIENSLLICQTDSSGPVGRPTQQILSTTLSPFYGMSTASLTSSQAVGLSSYRRESSVEPISPSASISSSINLPPRVLQSIPVLMATVGFPFHYSIPPKTFVDPEDGDAEALTLEIRLIDGPPISVGTWLALDGLELHGVPLEVDLPFAPQHLLLDALDRQGLNTWLPLTLDLHRSAVDPCHIFTLTAQRSLHSILRHRHRVELLLGKLSRFFNSSSNHHLSVVSMKPGSTVVSWYNHSLCGMGHNRLRWCHVDQIQSMWLAMRSTDGSVNPAFRESMLPEFPISKVGPVSFTQDCFSTTSTPMFDGSTPVAQTAQTPSLGTNSSLIPTVNTCASASPALTSTSQQMNHYQWTAGMFTALFIVCLLILIVLVVAAFLHFCKSRRGSRTVAIWPASRVLSVQSRDLRAIRPRHPPIFQPELPPPPLRLWINLSQGNEGSSPCERGRKTLDKVLQPRPPHDFSNI